MTVYGQLGDLPNFGSDFEEENILIFSSWRFCYNIYKEPKCKDGERSISRSLTTINNTNVKTPPTAAASHYKMNAHPY